MSSNNDKASFLSHDDATRAGFHSRRNRDRTAQDKARATFFALHGPVGRRENARERDVARAQRSDTEQIVVIAYRMSAGKDMGNSKREVKRLTARIEAAEQAKNKPTATVTPERKVIRQKFDRSNRK